MSVAEKRRRLAAGEAPPPNGQAGAPHGLITTPLDEITPEPVRWLVPEYIPLGKLVLFAGDGGHGKTTVTLQMTAALTTGRPCFGLDYPAPRPADVLVISCEDDFADTVVPRLLAAGADLTRVRRVDGVRGADGKPTPFSLAHYERLAEELAERPGVRLVVIDPAGAYIGAAGVDDHKDSELRSLLGPLAEMAARHRVTILLVKHLNKGVTAKAVHKVSGSAGYVNAVRAAFLVVPHPTDGEKKLFLPLKFNIGRKPDGVAFRLTALPATECDEILSRFPGLAGEDRGRLAAQLFRPEWEGSAGMDADTALSEGEHQQSTRVKECADWLTGHMGEWAWPDAELEQAAEGKGFTTDNFRKAKTLLRKDGRLQSRPDGAQGAWWNWLGERTRRPADRPAPAQSDETEESGETHRNGKPPPQSTPTLFRESDPLPD